MKVKVLEAFAYGLPVVTTPPGIEGIEVVDGIHAGVHSADHGLLERALRLLRDPECRRPQRRAARELLEHQYSPGPVIGRLENVYESIRSGRSA
jgi:glycosyltransferase involved in cell wall biosynthesis